MAAPILRVEIQGLKQFKRKLKLDALAGPAWHTAMEEMGKAGAAAARSRAPRGRTGNLAASVTSKLSSNATVMSARITAPAAHRGYKYGRALEYAPRLGRRAGVNQHQRWLLKALRSIDGQLEAILGHAARTIERMWAS